MKIEDIKIGDRITFRSPTRDGSRVANRIVNGFSMGRPTVSFFGWKEFIVRRCEIIEHHPAETTESAVTKLKAGLRSWCEQRGELLP